MHYLLCWITIFLVLGLVCGIRINSRESDLFEVFRYANLCWHRCWRMRTKYIVKGGREVSDMWPCCTYNVAMLYTQYGHVVHALWPCCTYNMTML